MDYMIGYFEKVNGVQSLRMDLSKHGNKYVVFMEDVNGGVKKEFDSLDEASERFNELVSGMIKGLYPNHQLKSMLTRDDENI